MSKVIDMTNLRFGQLVVLKRAENDKYGKAQWLCKCDCGNEKIINGASLRKGLTTSCGCNRIKKLNERNNKKVKDETGKVYGFLTVIDRNLDPKYSKDGRAMWNCVCECGNKHIVSGKLLREGKVTSCGCREKSKGEQKIEQLLLEHGINYTLEYPINVRKEKIYQHHKARFDFAIVDKTEVKYFIEYDGIQHFKAYGENSWNNEENFKKTQERDILKNQWCKENNIPLIRIPYSHYDNLCLEDLLLETSNFIYKE